MKGGGKTGNCWALIIFQVLNAYIKYFIDSHSSLKGKYYYPHLEQRKMSLRNEVTCSRFISQSLPPAGLPTPKAMLFPAHAWRGWGGHDAGPDPPRTSCFRRAGSTLWPHRACGSQTCLPEVILPAAVSSTCGNLGHIFSSTVSPHMRLGGTKHPRWAGWASGEEKTPGNTQGQCCLAPCSPPQQVKFR